MEIPLTLTVSNVPATLSNGIPYTTSPSLTLFGTSHAVDTRKVLVNGVQANWNAFDVRWTNTVALNPGINRVLVQSLNSNDVEFARATVDIWYDDSSDVAEAHSREVEDFAGAIGDDFSFRSVTYQKLFSLDNVKLKFTDGALAAVAKKAIARKAGARGLRSILEDVMLDIMYEIPSKKEVSECVVNEEVISGAAEPLLIYEKIA